jgi:hypothetical protein
VTGFAGSEDFRGGRARAGRYELRNNGPDTSFQHGVGDKRPRYTHQSLGPGVSDFPKLGVGERNREGRYAVEAQSQKPQAMLRGLEHEFAGQDSDSFRHGSGSVN